MENTNLELKECRICHSLKDINQFYIHHKEGKRRSECKTCHKAKSNETAKIRKLTSPGYLRQLQKRLLFEKGKRVCAKCKETKMVDTVLKKNDNKLMTKNVTVKEFAELLGVDYLTASAFIKILVKNGVAKENGKMPSPGGKGKPSTIYAIENEATLVFWEDEESVPEIAPEIAPEVVPAVVPEAIVAS